MRRESGHHQRSEFIVNISQTILVNVRFAGMEKGRIDVRRIVMINCGFTKALNIPYGKAVEPATKTLKEEGFGIPTEIDVFRK